MTDNNTFSNNRLINWFKLSSPSTFYPVAGKLIPFFWGLTALFGVIGLWISFFVAPVDAVQGQGYRIIFIHVPASWMSMFIYIVMAVWAGIGLIFNTRLSAMMAQALAPIGAWMAFLSLWTGAFWGKPMWGAWWVWDARLTSELILLFLSLGFIAGETAPAGRTMGHAGAIVGGSDDTAQAKKRIMRSCGIHVVDSPAEIGKKVKEVLG